MATRTGATKAWSTRTGATKAWPTRAGEATRAEVTKAGLL